MMNIGILGTGLMGQPLALRLQAEGYKVQAYNRSADKLTPLTAVGIPCHTTPQAVLQQTEVLLLFLSDDAAIRDVLLNPVHQTELNGKTCIQMGTIAPQQSRNLAKEIQQYGGEYLEAPVLGSIPEVKQGTLLVMVGATAAQFAHWQPLFTHLGKRIMHVGEVGAAAAMKLALNQLIAALTTAFSLSVQYAQTNGVQIDDFMQVLRDSALYAPTFDKKLKRMLTSDYANPNFPSKHLLKDVDLFLDSANGLNAASLQGIREVIAQTIEMGLAEGDYSALFEAVKGTSHV